MGKLIGITCGTGAGEKDAAGTISQRHTLNRAYVWAVERAGGVPLLLPVTRERDVIGRWLGAIDGLLLTGGVDLAPGLYGQEPHPELGEVDDDRDATEIPLTREALAQDMPIFAICRGLQILNVALGGTLYQDLPSQFPSSVQHRQGALGLGRGEFSHAVRVAEGSRLHGILGASEVMANSFHHQALRDLAPELVVTARASDGVVEGAEMPAHRWVLGVQYHPEETAPTDLHSRALFEAFVAAL